MQKINPHSEEWQEISKLSVQGARDALESIIAMTGKDDYHRGRYEAFMEILKAGHGREPELSLSFPPPID